MSSLFAVGEIVWPCHCHHWRYKQGQPSDSSVAELLVQPGDILCSSSGMTLSFYGLTVSRGKRRQKLAKQKQIW